MSELEPCRGFCDTEGAPHWHADGPVFTSVVHQCCEDRQVLLEALREAREMLADWSQYADPYFRAKHKLNDDLAEVDAVISRFTSP